MRRKSNAGAAAACALVLIALAACGGGGDSSEASSGSNDSFNLAAAKEDAGSAAEFVPAYAVTGTSTVKVGKYPSALAVNSKTNKIYVANRQGHNVTVIDGKTNKTTTVKTGFAPIAVRVNEVTNTIYVANLAGTDASGNESTNEPGSVTVIDGKTDKATKTVKAGLEPYAIGINTKTNRIYVGNQGGNDVTVIDGKTNRATKTIALRKDTDTLTEGVLSPQDVEVDETTNQVYVAGAQSNTVAVINGETNAFEVVKTETGETRQTGFTPTAIAVDEQRNLIYTSDYGSHDMTVIDVKAKTATGIVPEDIQEPYVIAMNPKTNKIYMGSPTSRSVTIVDGATKKPITIGDLPGKPNDVAINPVTNKIYFALSVAYKGASVGDDNQITGLIMEVDGETNKVVLAVAGISPWAIAVNSATNTIYAVNREGDDMTVFRAGGKG
ncbi:MAG: YncE family protein [Sporichthyaceae bacterium]